MINATVQLGVSDGVLVEYLAKQLDISAGKQHDKSPACMMFSVLSLSLSSYQQLKSQQVVNSSQNSKSTFDEQYRILFYVKLWVSKNDQNLFTKNEQIALLHYVSQCLSELSKVVAYSTVLSVMQDYEAMQTLTVDCICL